MTIKISTAELVEILEENYYALTTTGRQALLNIRADLEHKLFNENHKEWGTNDGDILDAIDIMEKEFYRDDKMDVPAREWQIKKYGSFTESPVFEKLKDLTQSKIDGGG